MIAAVWLMLSGLLYALQLQTGSFPKPLTAEIGYLRRPLRRKCYPITSDFEGGCSVPSVS
jgi:hypothetical protein